ncbi:alpha/beta fold hydrolase [Pyruvatibacter sp.]|uniref:alpha/beta fold hydrolase n=1 Tax=Pyruvatibacter sp. TaxID=1981328 RepID=UPI0032EF2EFE
MAIVVIVAAGIVIALTRDGQLVTPEGAGTVAIEGKNFEAFPLPDYAAKLISDDYKSYFIEVEPGIKVHMLEVGTGYPVFLMHGNPTSGFLYRKVADELPTDRLRLIMPTLVGLGFSSKVPASQHTLDNHMRWINAALAQLDLTELVYMGQDWGGAVGLGALSRSPGLIEGAVILNTGFNAPTQAGSLSRAHDIAKTPVLGEVVFEGLVSIFDRLRDAQGDPDSIPAEVADLYGRPVVESGNAKAPLAMMRMVPYSPDEPSSTQLRDIERYVAGLNIPVEIVWGINDPILGQVLPRMKQNFPDAPVTQTQGGHFLQEEVPAEIATALLRIIDQVQ